MSNGVVVVPSSMKPRDPEPVRVGTPVHELVDGARVAVEGEHDVDVVGEQLA